MPRFLRKDARIGDWESMFRGWFVMTYNAIQAMRRLDFDWYRFTGCQERELCQAFGLNHAPMLFFISHFSSFFTNLFWLFQQCIVRILGLPHLCAYNGMCLGQNWGHNPYALKVLRFDMITIDKLSIIASNLRFCACFDLSRI